MSKKKVATRKNVVNVDEILDMTKRTAENLNRWKKQGITTKVIAIDSLLSYCDKLDALIKRVKDLERTVDELKEQAEDAETASIDRAEYEHGN